MRTQFLLIGGLAFFAALNAQARIGYTLDECVKQYGTSYSNEDGKYEWNIGDNCLQARFENGKVVSMHYERPFLKKFTGSEIQDLYLKNGAPDQNLVIELYGTFGDKIPRAESSSHWVQSFRIVTKELSLREKAEHEAVLARMAALRAEREAAEKAAAKAAFDSL